MEHPVFITAEDRVKFTAIENMTVAELSKAVEECLSVVTDDDMRE